MLIAFCRSPESRRTGHRRRAFARAAVGALALSVAAAGIGAAPPQLTAFGDGSLTWSSDPGLHGFGVQWAPHAGGPWSTSWDALDALVATGTQHAASVPMFYRVSQGFTLASLRGAWIVCSPEYGDVYLLAQDDGVVSEGALFVRRAPAGVFTVGATGDVHITLIMHGEIIALLGGFAQPDRIELRPPYAPAVIRRVEDVANGMGAWSGSLRETSNPFAIPTYPVSFIVDERGLTTNVTGFAGHGVGRLYVLDDGTVSGFFYTKGTNADNDDPYDLFRINGTVTGNTLTGTYEADEPSVWGTVTLTRP